MISKYDDLLLLFVFILTFYSRNDQSTLTLKILTKPVERSEAMKGVGPVNGRTAAVRVVGSSCTQPAGSVPASST